MITKKFEQFINELKYTTYAKAAKGLEEKGHKERADKLRKHNSIHGIKLSMIKNYKDLRPFEIWAKPDGDYFRPDDKKTNKLTVYLGSWNYIPSEDNECQSVDISPLFLINTKEPYMNPSEFNLFKGEKEHRKGIDDILNGDYVANLTYYNDEVGDLYSFEGSESEYFKFTNRRDAVRFKKIIQSDEFFIESLIEATKGCDDLNAFAIHKKFVQTLKINDLYS